MIFDDTSAVPLDACSTLRTLPLALFGASGYAVLMGRLAMPSLISQAAAPLVGAVLMETVGAGGTLATLSLLALLNVGLVAVLGFAARRAIVPAAAMAQPS